MAFTDADEKKLAELLAKKEEAKREARNEQKRVDRVLQKRLNLTMSQIENLIKEHDKMKDLLTRFMGAKGREYDLKSFEIYVANIEEKSHPQY